MALGPSRPLIAFALLKQCSEIMKTDLLGGVALLIRPIVGDLTGKVYDSKVLAEKLATSYGLALPAEALEEFAPRLIDSGILIPEESQGGVTRVVYAAQPIVEVNDSSQEFQQILDEFIQHAQALLEKTNQSIEEEELLQALLRHLATLDFSAIRAKPIVNPDTQGKLVGPTTRDQLDLSEQLQKQAMLDAIVASFVTGLQSSGGKRLELLIQVADGALAAELVFDLRAPSSVPRLTNTIVIVDTPIILSLLDLSSAQDKEDAKRLLASITEAGGKIAAFQHSIEEAEGVLTATNNARGFGEAYGPAIPRLSNAVYRAYYESMHGKIASTWQQKHHYEIIQETAVHFYKNFSGEDEEALTSDLMMSPVDRALTRERDAKSIAETMRRLGGAQVSIRDVSSCRFMFVTPNTALRRRAANFLRSRGFVHPEEFTPIVTSRYMAGLCWLISGGKANQSPTTARLLANCAAALQLRPEISERTKRFLAEIDPDMASHFEALMTNERAAQYLAEATFNNPSFITANNVEDLYSEVQRRAAVKVALEKDAFYAEKLNLLESERTAADIAASKLKEQLGLVQLEMEGHRIESERLAATTSTLSIEHSEQRRSLEAQQAKIATLEQLLKTALERDKVQAASLLAYQEAARTEARKRAERWTKIFQISFALIMFTVTFALGYYDKMILPALPIKDQSSGTMALITIQALISITGFSIFTKWAQRPVETLTLKLYKSRLATLGIPETS